MRSPYKNKVLLKEHFLEFLFLFFFKVCRENSTTNVHHDILLTIRFMFFSLQFQPRQMKLYHRVKIFQVSSNMRGFCFVFSVFSFVFFFVQFIALTLRESDTDPALKD